MKKKIYFYAIFFAIVSCKSKNISQASLTAERSAYFQAFGKCDVEAIEKLKLKYGFSVDERSSTESTPLMVTAYRNQIGCVEYLLKNNAKIDLVDSARRSAVFYAIEGKSFQIVKMLLDASESQAEMVDGFNLTPLMVASKIGNVEIMKLLIERKASLHSRDENDWTPLFFAVVSKNFEAVKLLVESGAKTDIVDRDGNTPQSIAYEDLSFKISDYIEAHDKKGKLRKVKSK